VHHASRAYQTDLIRAGVEVALFESGLLHTKSITVDDRLCLFGSLNLDPRSLRLNFEITLAVYDQDFTAQVLSLQDRYLAHSRPLSLDECERRSSTTRLVENMARLLGPLL
jgi:cardiolipin synthase